MSLLKEFKEFLVLNEDRIYSKPQEFCDVYLGGNHLLRRHDDKCIIYFLTSSDSITIPQFYLDIFTHFNVAYSGKISEYIDKPKQVNDLDEIILDSVLLAVDIQSSLLYYKTDKILGRIEKIVNLGGTEKIREIVEDEIKLTIKPWIIENTNGSIEI